jgi:hypothetical protein
MVLALNMGIAYALFKFGKSDMLKTAGVALGTYAVAETVVAPAVRRSVGVK